MFAIIMLAFVLAAVLLGVCVAVRRPRRSGRRWLRWSALGLTVGVAAALAPYTIADSGLASGYLLGVPVLAAAAPVLADRLGVARGVADAVGAIVMTGWGVLLALGIGTAFLPGALLLFAVVGADVANANRAADRTAA